MEEATEGNQENQPRQRNHVLRRQTVSDLPQHVFKVLFIGDHCTGKKSLSQRYAYGKFSERHQSTIGAEYAFRTILWKTNTKIQLHLWNITGQDRDIMLMRPFYQRADAAFVVFDVSRPETFRSTMRWKFSLDDKVRLPCGARIPCVLLANKCDLPEKCAFVEDEAFMDKWTARYGFQGWLETSAKENIGVDEAVERLITNLMDVTVHRRVDQLRERRFALREADEACVCMNASPNRPDTISLLSGQAAISKCFCNVPASELQRMT